MPLICQCDICKRQRPIRIVAGVRMVPPTWYIVQTQEPKEAVIIACSLRCAKALNAKRKLLGYPEFGIPGIKQNSVFSPERRREIYLKAAVRVASGRDNSLLCAILKVAGHRKILAQVSVNKHEFVSTRFKEFFIIDRWANKREISHPWWVQKEVQQIDLLCLMAEMTES